jgi:predicted PurR-regulated permease PerM
VRPAEERTVVAWSTAALLAATALVLWPFAPWILFALWAGTLARPVHAWFAARFGGRPRLAAAVTTLALVVLAAPAIVLIASLADDAIALVRRLAATDRVHDWFYAAAGTDGRGTGTSGGLGLITSQGARAWDLARQVAGTAGRIALGLVIAIGGLYGVLADGARWYGWLEAHAPISRASFRRFAGAFVETGRGLFFGTLGAGLAQAIIATIVYIALGVPRPFALGMLTLACSIVPAVGTAIVWGSVAVALAVTGRDAAAVILVGCGVFLIGTVDNVVRPYLARKGHLQLPTLVVALAMFGGVAAMGARGLLLGPLILRLAKEALAIRRDQASK